MDEKRGREEALGIQSPEGEAEAPDIAVRERLLAAATELFSRKGYAATTVREIVAAAGVTKPVLYYYFRNKEGIYLELMRKPAGEFNALLDAAVGEDGSSRDRIASLSVRVYDLFVRHLDLARIMYAIYYGPPQGAPFVDFDAYHAGFQDAVSRLVEEGIRRGELREAAVADMTWAVVGAVNIAMEVALCHPERSLGADGLVRVLDLVFEGMAKKDGETWKGGRP
jgi:TetR/AcrR family transcriptional regulator